MAQNNKFTRQTVGSDFSLKEHKDFQKDLLISLSSSLSKDDYRNWAVNLWAFQEAYGKILYSELSKGILEETDESIIKTLAKNLDIMSNYIREQYPKSIKFDQYQFWLKYNDHCQLALLQRKHYKLSKATVEEMSAEKIKDEASKIQKALTSQLIGLVTMFTALSFVIFGGTQMLSSILDNVKIATVPRMICVGFLWTLCMSVLFYIFVWFIIRIIKPDEKDIFSTNFKKLFITYIEILMAILIVFTILSFINPCFFYINYS